MQGELRHKIIGLSEEGRIQGLNFLNEEKAWPGINKNVIEGRW